MTTNELRACPFCGKKRHLRFEPFEGSTDTGIVVCICGASYTTIEQGADWNTRPIEDGLQAEIEKLKKQVKEQPTTNCSKLGSKFAIKQVGKSEGYVIYRENEFIGVTTFGNDKDVYVVARTRLSPSELRGLADLVEDTPEVI